jgi:hypothetical protein
MLRSRLRPVSDAVLSPEDVKRIRAEIEPLEEARKQFTDSGIVKQIDFWIAT